VEVLPLQPQVLMVVVITSTGGVSKRLFTFPAPVDRGLVEWAASYLNERMVGLGLGARILHQRLVDPTLSATELRFLASLSPVFTNLAASDEATLYVEGTAKLLAAGRLGDVSELNLLMETLERRVSMLGALRSALGESSTALPVVRGVAVRIGAENELPALHSVALVAAAYGLPQRPGLERLGVQLGLRHLRDVLRRRRRRGCRRLRLDVRRRDARGTGRGR
jgi:heat-inducible transcriptional repressor